MLDLTDAYLVNLSRQGVLSKDENGQTIFVGLTRVESERYHSLSSPTALRNFSDAAEFLILDSKHALAINRTMPTTDPRIRRV